MIIGIVGTQSFQDLKKMEDFIFSKINLEDIDLVVSGGAVGADTLAREFAKKHQIRGLLEWYPQWKRYPGKSAAFHRNKLIVEHSDIVFAFWDGKSPGTKLTIDLTKESGKTLYLYKII